MKQLIQLITPSHVSALGWTLLHSLWQGALLCSLAGLGFYLLRRRSASARYTLGVVALGSQVVASLATYLYYLPAAIEKTGTSVQEPVTFAATYTKYASSATLPLMLRAQLWLATHLSELVICWMIGVGVLLVRFVGGWVYLERIRYTSRKVKDGGWNTRFGLLMARLNMAHSVEFRETSRIITPMVIGVLQPVVLVPMGLLTGLSSAQVEAILAHELAHIRRYDYLVNMLQSLVEVIYFFHPALWWLSNRIRAEREHCCDDLAMVVCGDRMSLARALVRVAEFGQESRLVVAFASSKPLLLQRVKRVLGVSEKPRQGVFGYFPMAIVLLSLLIGASVHAYQKEDPEEKPIRKAQKLSRVAAPPAPNAIQGLSEDTLIEVSVEPPVEAAVESEIAVMVENRMDMIVINDTIQKKMTEYHEKMRALQLQMKPYQEEMQALHKQMAPLQRKMEDLHLDMEKQRFEVERVQREQEKIDWKKQQAMQARQELMQKRSALMYPKAGQNKLSEAELEKQLATFESQLKAKEQEITALNEQISQSRQQMGEAEKPMNDLEAEMDKISREMEAYGQKIEALDEKMEVIGRKMESESREMEGYIPRPPAPPKSPKAAAPVKGKIAPTPPQSPKALAPGIKGKVAPPPPPAKPAAPPRKD